MRSKCVRARHGIDSSTFGRTHRGRGALPKAIGGFERAAQAPPPSPEEGYMLIVPSWPMRSSRREVARALANLH